MFSPTVVCMAIYDMGNMSLQVGREAAGLFLKKKPNWVSVGVSVSSSH